MPARRELTLDLTWNNFDFKAKETLTIVLLKNPSINPPYFGGSLRFLTVGQHFVAPGQDSKLGYDLLLKTLFEMLKSAGQKRVHERSISPLTIGP